MVAAPRSHQGGSPFTGFRVTLTVEFGVWLMGKDPWERPFVDGGKIRRVKGSHAARSPIATWPTRTLDFVGELATVRVQASTRWPTVCPVPAPRV